MVLLLLVYCLMYLPMSVGVLCWSLFWFALLCVLSSFVIILTRKRELVALPLLFSWFLVAVNFLWLLLTVPWDGPQCVIVVFSDHTHLILQTLVVFMFKKGKWVWPGNSTITHKDYKSQATSSLFPSGKWLFGKSRKHTKYCVTNVGIDCQAWY